MSIGKPVKRKEDQRFVTGNGNYTADVEYPVQAHLYLLRAQTGHAKILSIGTEAAAGGAGVLGVYTAADLDAAGIKDMQASWMIYNPDGSPMHLAPREALARDFIRYVGQPVVAVVAETRLQAKDASELVDLELEELPAVGTMKEALADNAEQVWDHMPNNLCVEWVIGDAEATAKAFDSAAHIVETEVIQNRLVPNAMEPRAVVAVHSSANDEYTLHVSHQNPHLLRTWTCAHTLPVPESKLRVVAADVGGGFGSKIYQYPEDLVALHAAKVLGRAVKWVGERSEAFVSDAHARDHETKAELAIDKDGKFLGMRVHTDANLGAQLSNYGAAIPTVFYATMLGGVYDIPAFDIKVRGVVTNTVPTDAYRGAGRPEATYLVERLVDLAANATGIGRIDIRRRNFIPEFPYESPLGLVYDSGAYEQCVQLALEKSDMAGFEARKAASEAAGKRRGFGFIVYTEQAGAAPSQAAIAFGSEHAWFEVATIRVNPDASVTVLTGAHSHGQSHETTMAQIVADQFGIAIEDVEVIHGDTAKLPFGIGTFASRSMSAGGSAVLMSGEKIIAKGKKIAAHMLEAELDEVDFIDGFFKVKNSDRILAFKEVAKEAYVPGNYPLEALEPGLEETTFFDPPNFTFPAGCHIAEVEVDPETGVVDVERYTVCDDFGVVINPMVVHGQIHGGVAQGLGQALLEDAAYDAESGQLLSASFLDYGMPRADDMPAFECAEVDTVSPSNPLGAKGCGEAGTIGAPITVMNAIFDALKPLGVEDITMPATPAKVWAAIQQAQSS
ncbi:MAG: xanthine dehydrogenase family protein molybdopterin-binding subunit [Pseudomonadota bacterium]